jgi:LysM repeat protein
MIYRCCLKPLVLLVIMFGLSSHSVVAQDMIHTVVKGETVYSISRLYKVSQEELMRRNGIADASKLQLGMRLTVPSGSVSPTAVTTTTTTAAYSEYTVAKNDTLYSIARTRGVMLQALRDINGFSKNHVLKVGEKIKIPASAVVVAKPTPKNTVQATPRKVDPSIRWPVAAREILYMNSNAGVLVSGKESESVKSLTGGTVVYASPWRGYGNVAVVETGSYRYLYGSCETLSVRKGDSIEPGTELGKLGIYPASGKPDLVFIVSQNGSPLDPAKAPRF